MIVAAAECWQESWRVESATQDLSIPICLDDIPRILSSVAKLAARNTRTETVIADGNRLILERIGKVVFALRHSSDEDADALLRT